MPRIDDAPRPDIQPPRHVAHVPADRAERNQDNARRTDTRATRLLVADRADRSSPQRSAAQTVGSPRLTERQQAELAQRYAPVRYLHPDEDHNPGNPEEFLKHAKPERDGDKVRLNLPDDPKLQAGDRSNAPTYYKYDEKTRTMTYWFFYPYNKAPNAGPLNFDHEGDWERVEVQFDQKFQPTAARYSNHGSSNSYGWSELEKENGRPVVYVAKGTHANNAHAGEQRPPDVPSRADIPFVTTKNFNDRFGKGEPIDSGSDLRPLQAQPWLNSKLEQRYGAEEVLWGGTKKGVDADADVGLHPPTAFPTPVRPLPGVKVDYRYYYGDSPDGPERAPYGRGDVGKRAERVLDAGNRAWRPDDDHQRLEFFANELEGAKDDAHWRAQLVRAVLERDDGAFKSWLKTGIADDLVRDGRISQAQLQVIRDSVAAAQREGTIRPGELPGGW